MSGPIFTKCARRARKRTIGALVVLRLSDNLKEIFDNKLLWATLPHEMRRKRRDECRKKTKNLDSARTWRFQSQWRVADLHSAAVFRCSIPMADLFYKAVPVLAHEDKVGPSVKVPANGRVEKSFQRPRAALLAERYRTRRATGDDHFDSTRSGSESPRGAVCYHSILEMHFSLPSGAFLRHT